MNHSGAHGLGSPFTRQPYLGTAQNGERSHPTSMGNILSRRFPGSPTVAAVREGQVPPCRTPKVEEGSSTTSRRARATPHRNQLEATLSKWMGA